jgi:hypothetical protein
LAQKWVTSGNLIWALGKLGRFQVAISDLADFGDIGLDQNNFYCLVTAFDTS